MDQVTAPLVAVEWEDVTAYSRTSLPEDFEPEHLAVGIQIDESLPRPLYDRSRDLAVPQADVYRRDLVVLLDF